MSRLVRFVGFAVRARPWLLWGAWLLCATACSGSSASEAALGSGGGADAGAAGADDSDDLPAPMSLAFAPNKLVQLSPKQSRKLTLKSDPPGRYQITFALLGSGSDSAPGDAVLDTSVVQTADDGIAHVTLTAPSMPSTFSVRASAAGNCAPSAPPCSVQTQIGVAVSSLGYTTLSVLPSYSGHRSISAWTATARTGTQCSKLTGNPPPDGDLSVTANAAAALTIAQVPIGVPLTVTLRAGHYVGGCVDQAALSESDGNQVLVYASDRAVNLGATQLSLSFGPSDDQPAFSKLMKSSVTLVESALVGGRTSDVQALLDAMHDATNAADGDAFNATRTMQSWDTALGNAFGRGSATRLRDPVDRWLMAGLSSFNAPDTFAGLLSASGSGAAFDLVRVAQVAPADASVPKSIEGTWSADSSDTLLFGMQLSWLPSRLVTALAIAPALLEFPQQPSLEAALAQSVDCSLVSKTLLAHGVTPGALAYGACDATCVLATCTSALSALWQSASGASGSDDIARLGVTATGTAEVGDAAEVTSLKGSWLGELSIGADSAPVSGVLSALGSGA